MAQERSWQDRAEGSAPARQSSVSARKGKMLPTSEGDLKYLEIMGQDENTAPAEDFLMRDRLLSGEKLFSNSICLFYIHNEPDSVQSNYVWEGFRLRDS